MARRPVLENAVMDVLWGTDAWLTPGEVQVHMAGGDSLAYTTVMTVMNRLWKKGRLDRRKRGRAYEYGPVLGQEEFAAAQMAEMLAIASDRDGALSRFVDELSADDRDRLRRVLEGP